MDPWLRELRRTASGAAPAAVAAAVACGLARGMGPRRALTGARLLAGHADAPGSVPLPPLPGDASPHLVGAAYEAMLPAATRRGAGAHYTPPSVATALVTIALDGRSQAAVCDPTVGGGAFLLAAADRLAAAGVPRRRVVERLLWGIDADADAVAVAEVALLLWCGRAVSGAALAEHLVVGDALLAGRSAWPSVPAQGFDVVAGNPPFLNQLHRATARTPGGNRALRTRYGDVVRGYADTAALFLLAGLDLAAPGGDVVLVQPASILASRDTAPVRRAVTDRAALRGLWLAGEPAFAAGVRVCAPVLKAGAAQPARVRRWRGATVRPAPAVAATAASLATGGSWAPLAAGLLGVPPTRWPAGPTLGDLVTATAGFRDQFYGLVPHVTEDDGRGHPLVTCGLIEPGACRWGRRWTRFAGRRLRAPVVHVDDVNGELGGWLRERSVPKVVVATQTRALEAAVDETGAWVPSVPTIAVHADEAELWRVAAAILAPPVTAWALEHCGGTALAADALKPAARQLLAIPLPRSAGAWDEGAAALRDRIAPAARQGDGQAWREGLVAFGETMLRAHGQQADDPLLAWWAGRLPRWRPDDVDHDIGEDGREVTDGAR